MKTTPRNPGGFGEVRKHVDRQWRERKGREKKGGDTMGLLR